MATSSTARHPSSLSPLDTTNDPYLNPVIIAPFSARSTTHPEDDSDSEFGNHGHQPHTPLSSVDQEPHYDDLPPTYEQAQTIARSEYENALNQPPGQEARDRADEALRQPVQPYTVNRMVYSTDDIPNAASGNAQTAAQGRGNMSRENIPVDDDAVGRGVDIQVHHLPSYGSVAGGDQDRYIPPQISSNDMQDILNGALEFTKAESDSGGYNQQASLARKIVIPPTSRPLEVSQFARAYTKALSLQSISPAQFGAFIDGLNLVCRLDGFSPALAGVFDNADSLLASYLAGANEAFFAPRGLKVGLCDLRSLLSALNGAEPPEKVNQILLDIQSFETDPFKKAEVLTPIAEPLNNEVPEPDSKMLALRARVDRLIATGVRGDVAQPSLPCSQSQPEVPHLNGRAPPFVPRPSLSKAPTAPPQADLSTAHAPPPVGSAQSWAGWGADYSTRMAKWSEDYGKLVGQWSESLGQEVQKRGEALSKRVEDHAEHLSRTLTGEGSRAGRRRGCGSRPSCRSPLIRPAFGGALGGGLLGGGLLAGGPFGGRLGDRGRFGRGGFGAGGPGACGNIPWAQWSGHRGLGGWRGGRHAAHVPDEKHGDDDDNVSISSDSSSESSESSESEDDNDSEYATAKEDFVSRANSINARADAALSVSKKPASDIEADRVRELKQVEKERMKFESRYQKRAARRSVKRESRTIYRDMRREYRNNLRDKKRAHFAAQTVSRGRRAVRDRKADKRSWRDERRKHRTEFRAKAKELRTWTRDQLKQIDDAPENGKMPAKGVGLTSRDLEQGAAETGVVGRSHVDMVGDEVWILIENLD